MPATSDGLALVPGSQGRLQAVVERLARRVTRGSVVPLTLGMIALVGIGDSVTGIELPFTILYLLPIALGSWYRGYRFGIALSLAAAATMTISLVRDHMSSFGVGWNLGGATLLFVTASWALNELHAHVERERTLRSMAVDQLRHAERLNVIGTLAAGVAHELGTPLNVIGGCAEIMLEDRSKESVQRRSQMIIEQVAKVSSIIRHLLDFGHRGKTATGSVDLNAIAQSATEMLQSTARRRGTTIVCDLGAPVMVTGNAAELEQVVSNLILNGLQAMSGGGHDEVRVHVGCDRLGKHAAWVKVEDSGPGIPPDVLPRIFDPFFTTKGVGEGTGLGLSVSYGIVRDHDGTITVDSQRGRGTVFTVALPVRDERGAF